MPVLPHHARVPRPGESISEEVDYLKRHVVEQGFAAEHAVHAGPLIRREADYSSLDLNARKKLF